MSDPTEYGNTRIVPVDDPTLPPEVEKALDTLLLCCLTGSCLKCKRNESCKQSASAALISLHAHITALRAERDRYRAMAEWLADNCETYDRTGQGWLTEDWLKAAEEATR